MMKLILLSFLCCISSFKAFAQSGEMMSNQQSNDSINSGWTSGFEAYYYLLPNEKNTSTLFGYADYNAFHIEARYNYEDLNTASVFGGYRFETGNKLTLGATPIAGIVFGNTNGFAPGLLLDLTFNKFDFYSESEYLIDFDSKENNFLYTWAEFAITPVEDLRTGVVVNRTKLFATSLDIERGVFAQFSVRKITAGLFYFNPFSNSDYVMLSLGVDF